MMNIEYIKEHGNINSSKKFLATCKSHNPSENQSISEEAETSPAYFDTKFVKNEQKIREF